MEFGEIEDSIKIIFDKEEYDQKETDRSYFYKTLGDKFKFDFPNAETLVELFLTLTNNKQKTFFINFLKKAIIDSEEILWGKARGGFSLVGGSPLCFFTLLQLGYANDALESLKKRRNGRTGIYTLICHILEENYFDATQLKELSNKINNDLEQSLSDIGSDYGIWETLQSKLIQMRFELLKKQIKKVNVEINIDKKTVSEKINQLGLNQNYNELLTCIDAYIQADTPKPVNAGMINNLRAFMANLMTDIANRIAENEHEKIPKIKESDMGNVRIYLKTKLDLTTKDDKFIDSFIDILHAEGGHSFISEKEYFRLSKNIAIEIALFILSKYEKYEKD
jgi:hypothetical protein